MKSNNLAKMIGKRVVQSCITILLVTLRTIRSDRTVDAARNSFYCTFK